MILTRSLRTHFVLEDAILVVSDFDSSVPCTIFASRRSSTRPLQPKNRQLSEKQLNWWCHSTFCDIDVLLFVVCEGE